MSKMSCIYLSTICLWCLVPLVLCLAKGKEPHVNPKQKKPFFFPKYRPEIFYDNKVLPDNVEVDVFVNKGQLQRLFYVVEGSFRPLSITVTPCCLSTPLEWSLSLQPLPRSWIEDRYKRDPVTKRLLLSQPFVDLPPSLSYNGFDRRSYTSIASPPGIYILEMNGKAATQAKVVVTPTSCEENAFHPILPSATNVQIVKAKRNRVLISWKPSPSKKSVEYCVTSNTARNYRSFCSAQLDLYGNRQASPPASAGFGFPWEKLSKKSGSTSSNFVTEVPKNNASIVCVGKKTWHMFRGLERGKTYYFDVFVFDTATNASTAYVGVKAAIKPSSRYSWIKEDILTTLTLDKNNGYATTLRYQRSKSPGPPLVFIQSCNGPGPILFTISMNGANGKAREILNERIIDVKTFEIPQEMTDSNTSSSYTFRLKSTTHVKREVQIHISSRKHLFPYPMLPNDKNVKVFDTLTACDSITIGWRASQDEKVKYCIYKSAAQDELLRKTLSEPSNTCEATPVANDTVRTTVLCRRYHRFSKRRFNNVIMQRVRGLQPGTTYLFEVQITKVKGNMLPYERVWASTLKSCSRTRSKR